MRKRKRAAALCLAACLLLALAGCGGAVGGYKIIETLGAESYAIGFRNDDVVRYYIEAAIYTLTAEGAVHSAALQWFTEDPSGFPSDAGAMEALGGQAPARTLIVGASPDAFPVSYQDENGSFSGFDIDVARAVCERLGWTVTFLPIRAEDAYVELSSGNVDVAWGGLALDQTATDYTVVLPYMENELVLAARGDSSYSSRRRLEGAVLAIDVDQRYMELLAADEALLERLGQVKRISGGAPALFDALSTSQADVILVSRLAVQYYSR